MKKTYMTRVRTQQLVDLLRRNFLYQTPQVVFLDEKDAEPDHMILKMRTSAYKDMLKMIIAAGGWSLTPADRRKVIEQHELKARRAVGDGVNYDLNYLSHGDLVAMHAETKGVPELDAFHVALRDELRRRSDEARGVVAPAADA